MKVLSATSNIRLGGIELRRGNRYVASDHVASAVLSAAAGLVQLVADATIYTRPWRGESLEGKRLLIYRALGIGDEFIAARLAAYAKTHLNAHQVGLACFESHHSFWAGTTDLPFKLFPSIIQWSDWQAAHYHVIGEHWWEQLGTRDQPDTWSILDAVCNIQIPPEHRVPYIPAVPPEIQKKTTIFLAPWRGNRQVILWQLSATSRIRSYPPEQTRRAMNILLEKTDACILAAGHPAQIAEYQLPEHHRVTTYSAGIPGLIALAQAVHTLKGIVICPDSVLGHIAAAWPTLPVISLWSAFDPSRRVATYVNHHPIYRQIKCSPCWSHEHNSDPAQYTGCPHTACNDYCAGMRSIPPEQIAEAAVKHLAPSTTHQAPSTTHQAPETPRP